MAAKLAERLRSNKPLILDGAMGTELQRRGSDTGLPMWSANALFSKPALIQQIHEEYIAAGADIITTNTFRTTRRTMHRANLPDRSRQLTERAVDLAMRAREHAQNSAILIAGSIAPLEDCYRPDLVPSDQELCEEHEELAGALANLGVDFLLIETMNTVREAFAAGRAAEQTGKEFVVSFVCNAQGHLLSGETLSDAIDSLAELRPAGFSINCVSPRYMGSALTEAAAQIARSSPGTHLGVYGNIGNPESDVHGWEFTHDVDEAGYASHVAEWVRLGASIVGGCCGTTPAYIKAAAKTLGQESARRGTTPAGK
ncbi:MAG: homocysteine S-methyltransferase family protein [Ignavibacteria bacterium]|nr:homocysteine S-methyltransferase family protein [Ignavibacteria bacterium]